MQYSIVIVDDHLLIAKAITSIIDQFQDFHVLYECENGQQLIDKLSYAKNIPDILLLDISMPVMNGFDTATWVRSHHPDVLIMALSMQDDDDSLLRMIKCGAKGYLNKNVHPLELEKALATLVSKGFYYPDWAASRIFLNVANEVEPKENVVALTEREKEFLGFACTELTYKEIGEKMFCSPRTVESYRDALFEKLAVRTRVALALYAAKIGLYKL